MKKLFFAVAVVAAGAFAMADEAKPTEAEQTAVENAEKEDVNPFVFEAGVDVLSDYMWRGIILDDNWVWQPSVTIGVQDETLGKLYFNYWASFDLTSRRNRIPYGNNSRQFCSMQEQDFYIGYAKSFGDFDFEIGHYWYDYPYNGKNDGGDNHCAGSLGSDITFQVAYNNPIATLSAEALWNYSTMHGKDPSRLYVRVGASHDFTFLDDKLTITPKTVLGIGDHEFTKSQLAGYRENSRDNYGVEMTDHTTSLSASYAFNDHFSIGAKICYTWVPSHSLRQERWMTGGHDSRNGLVWGGFSANYSF